MKQRSQHRSFRVRKARLLALLVASVIFSSFTGGEVVAQTDELLPPSKFVLPSTIQVNLTTHSARLPLHRGSFQGQTVWYVLTDVSNQALAQQIGLNFAPKLGNSSRGCPGCVQDLPIPENILNAGVVEFKGIPDFSPARVLVPGPMGFPVLTAQPGARAGLFYTPYVQVSGTNIVYNAPVVAIGDGPFDVTTHTNTHDRVLAIDTTNMTVDLLVIRAFSGGKEVVYLSFDSSSEEAAVLERSTFTPVLAGLPFPDGEFRIDGARAALFAFANGQTGSSSPPAQGLNHLVIDGRNAEEATLSNTALLAALRNGGDARNVLDVFPTMTDPRFRLEYSPAWDLHLTFWSMAAVASGANVAQTDSNIIRTLATQWVVGSPGGLFLRSAGIEVNCPVVAFVNDPPLAPVVPSPFPLPLPFHDPPPILSFGQQVSNVSEGAGVITLTVTRTANTSVPVEVDFTTVNGSASDRSDFTAAAGRLRFEVGETEKTVQVFVTDDRFAEGAESFTVTLSNPTMMATIPLAGTVTVNINDNDSASGPSPVNLNSFNSDFFVRQHYVDFLGREADAQGLAFWKGQLDECTTQACLDVRRVNVSAAFFLSIEFQETGYFAYRAYQAAFGRRIQDTVPLTFQEFLPDMRRIREGVIVGQGEWARQLELNKQAFLDEFMARPAFMMRYPDTLTAAQFIDQLNANTGGSLTQAERDDLVNRLSTAAVTRRQALREVVENAAFRQREFNRAFVLMEYFGYLRRNPNDASDANFSGFNFWLAKLEEFGGDFQRAEMVKAFLDSSEYQRRFGL
jgi:hypothetical protein